MAGSWPSRSAMPGRGGPSGCCRMGCGMKTPPATSAGPTYSSIWPRRTPCWSWMRSAFSSFLKKATKSVGGARQYSGTAGRIENCQIGVFLGYASTQGQALIDRDLYLPKAWTADRRRCAAAAVPADVAFATKPELARRMIERALAARVPFAWVVGDEVYGNDRRLRMWLEQNERPHVLAVKATEPLWAWVEGHGPLQVAAQNLVAGVAPA